MTGGGPEAPALLRRLLEALLPRSVREFVLGDLEEGFRVRARERGKTAARWWYRRQALRSLWDTRGLPALTGSGAASPDARRTGADGDRGGWVRGLRHDVRGALRSLRRSPGFSGVTVVTLGLGLGATVGIFSVVHGIVLSPLPYPESEELVTPRFRAEGIGIRDLSTSEPMYLQLRERSQALEAVAVWDGTEINVATGEGTVRLAGARVSGDFFDLLGIPAAVGRTLGGDDVGPGAPTVAVLSHGLWESRFGGHPSAVGRTLRVAGQPTEVVGVMPAGFAFPRAATEIWVPLDFAAGDPDHGSYYMDPVARLAPGATVAEARADVDRIMRALPRAYPGSYEWVNRASVDFRVEMQTLKENLVGDVDDGLLLLLGSVLFLLLVAAANVANLFLVRAESRQREMALRTALGAGRRRLARHVIAESLALALAGGALGVLLATAGIDALMAWNPMELPRAGEVELTGPVLAFAGALSLGAGLLCAVQPALRAARERLGDALRGGRTATASGARVRGRSLLVAGQVALALLLLSGSVLMARSFWNLSRVDPGFEPESVLTFRLSFDPVRYQDDAETGPFVHRLLDRIEGLPGVSAAGAVNYLPLARGGSQLTLYAADDPPDQDEVAPSIPHRFASEGYFDALGIRLVRGRGLERRDAVTRSPSVVIDRSVAARFWPDRDPVGQRLAVGPNRMYTVVGVVESVRDVSLTVEPREMVYFPVIEPEGRDEWDGGAISVAVRTAGPPSALTSRIRRMVDEIDSSVPMADVRTMDELVAGDTAQTSFLMLLLGLAAVLSLALGGIGLFGVVSYVVARRRREIGVRIAVGASAPQVQRLVLGRSLAVSGAGLAAGVVAALALARFLDGLLFEVSPRDPATLAATSALLLAVAAAAAWLPARRAARTDPMEALRAE